MATTEAFIRVSNRFARSLVCCVVPLMLTATALSVSAQPSSKAKHCLWKVEGRTNQVYLLGAIPFSNSNFFPLPKVIEDAYKQSRLVVFEFNVAEADSPAALEKRKYAAGDSLKNHVSKEVYDKLRSYLLDEGGQGSELDSFTPIVAAYGIANHAAKKFGFDMLQSVDRYVFANAKEDKKQLLMLESVDSAFSVLTGLGEKAQEALLEDTLREAQSKTEIPAIAAAWKNGDTNALDKLLLDGLRNNPELGKRMVTDRNKNWIDKIEKVITGGTNAFLVVGVGHLIGKDSLVDLLSKRGFKVTQM